MITLLIVIYLVGFVVTLNITFRPDSDSPETGFYMALFSMLWPVIIALWLLVAPALLYSRWKERP